MKDFRLYGYWRSSCSWRVRIALALKQVRYESIPVHLVKDGGEQHQVTFQAINALRQVPVLAWHEGGVEHHLTQSLAILRFLDDVMPEPPLLPQLPLLRARALEAAEIVNAGIQPLQNLSMLKRVSALGGDRKAYAQEVIAQGFAALERVISRSSGQFAVGERPTLADCCLVPQVYNARRFDIDLTPFPTILAVDAACAELEAFRNAHPDMQPDVQN